MPPRTGSAAPLGIGAPSTPITRARSPRWHSPTLWATRSKLPIGAGTSSKSEGAARPHRRTVEATLSHELRPTILEEIGLLPAIKFLAEGVAARTGLSITVEGDSEFSPTPLLSATVYRIIQEAFTNVTRHAKATHVHVTIQHERQTLRCSVKDNGVGFDVSSLSARTGEGGLGMIGIRERLNSVGGDFLLTSTLGRGTELVITIPHTM